MALRRSQNYHFYFFFFPGAAQFDELTGCLKSLEYPFESCVKDLRSQVVRECCITIAFLSQCLRNKVSRGQHFIFS